MNYSCSLDSCIYCYFRPPDHNRTLRLCTLPLDGEQVDSRHSSSLNHFRDDRLTSEILNDQLLRLLRLNVMNDTQVDGGVTSRTDYDTDVHDDDGDDDEEEEEDAATPLQMNFHSEQVQVVGLVAAAVTMNSIQRALSMVKSDADTSVMMLLLDHCYSLHLGMLVHLMCSPIHWFPMQVFEQLHLNMEESRMNTVTLNGDRKCSERLMMMKPLHQR